MSCLPFSSVTYRRELCSWILWSLRVASRRGLLSPAPRSVGTTPTQAATRSGLRSPPREGREVTHTGSDLGCSGTAMALGNSGHPVERRGAALGLSGSPALVTPVAMERPRDPRLHSRGWSGAWMFYFKIVWLSHHQTSVSTDSPRGHLGGHLVCR